MAGALSAIMPTQAARTSGGALTAPPPLPQAAAAPDAPQQSAQPQTPALPPAPSHAQTVATLRHFQAILTELQGLLKNPDLGKADLKSAIIDGTTKLVADRMIAPGTAVTQLATVPEKPFDQRTWIQTHMQQTIQARDAILAHHAAAFAGQGPQPAPDPDSHMADMSGLMSQYSQQSAH